MVDHRPLTEQCDALICDIERDIRANTENAWAVYGELEVARFSQQQIINAHAKIQKLLPNVSADLITDAINGVATFDDLLSAN